MTKQVDIFGIHKGVVKMINKLQHNSTSFLFPDISIDEIIDKLNEIIDEVNNIEQKLNSLVFKQTGEKHS